MNVVLRPRITKEEFLEWEARQELRYEFDGLRAIAMVGGTRMHARSSANVLFHLMLRLRGGPCEVYGSDMRIEVAGRIRYPDAFVTCGPSEQADKVVVNPVVIFEVASAGTALVDQTIKNTEYEATPSVQRYVMLSQETIAATVFARTDGRWTGTLVSDPAAILVMPEIGIEIPLVEFYEGVTLPARD